MEAGVQHNVPHFHAYYQNDAAVFKIDTIELIAGNIPKRQRRFIEAWTELHRDELLEDWKLLQNGNLPFFIEPLK